ncbi:MAG: S8 family serine peptidase [Planctomycetota bacterium]
MSQFPTTRSVFRPHFLLLHLRAVALSFAYFVLAVAADGEDLIFHPAGPFTPTELFATGQDASADEFVRLDVARENYKVAGEGFAAVVIDSGINSRHGTLAGTVIDGHDFSGSGDTLDRYGHGTGVAALIAAQLASSNITKGVAPKAKLIPLKVYSTVPALPPDTGPTVQRINEALKWVLDNHQRIKTEYGVQVGVVNLSLGYQKNLRQVAGLPHASYYQTQRLVQTLRDRRILVVVAAGNHFGRYDSKTGMDFPAICGGVFSVGAVFDSDFSPGPMGFLYADGSKVYYGKQGRCTPFTQRLGGDELTENHTTIFAPGNTVYSASPFFDRDQDKSQNGETVHDGTSRSAPIVAGTVLLLQQHYKRLLGTSDLPPVDQIEECLTKGGIKFTDSEEDPPETFDNVKSTEREFVRLDIPGALKHLTEQFQQAVTGARMAAGNAAEGAPIEINGFGVQLK